MKLFGVILAGAFALVSATAEAAVIRLDFESHFDGGSYQPTPPPGEGNPRMTGHIIFDTGLLPSDPPGYGRVRIIDYTIKVNGYFHNGFNEYLPSEVQRTSAFASYLDAEGIPGNFSFFLDLIDTGTADDFYIKGVSIEYIGKGYSGGNDYSFYERVAGMDLYCGPCGDVTDTWYSWNPRLTLTVLPPNEPIGVPEPTALALFGSGLALAGAVRRRRR